MKNSHLFQVLVCLTLSLAVSSYGTTNTYKITVDYIAVGSDGQNTSETQLDNESVPDNGSSSNTEQTSDLKNATITITFNVTNDAGETEVAELASGNFNNGKFEFEGEIDEAIYVKASVKTNEKELTKWGLVVPGGPEVSFALVEQHGPYPSDQLVMAGASRHGKDSAKKFTISGDFSSLDRDMSLGITRVSGSSWNEDGDAAPLTSWCCLTKESSCFKRKRMNLRYGLSGLWNSTGRGTLLCISARRKSS